MVPHPRIYELAEAYEIAFDFRDVGAECDFLCELARRALGREAGSFLELAAGPAFHALELASRGLRASALDLSPEMRERALARARARGLELGYVRADMCAFELEERFDLAAILMDSTAYLLDNEAVLAHLDCVARHLVDGGVYVLEMGHPRYVFRPLPAEGRTWSMEREGMKVRMQWGEDEDPFDPTTQLTETRVSVEYDDGERSGRVTERCLQRCFVPNELRALVLASGRFRLLDTYGSMSTEVPFDDSEAAWRMVPVLQKIA
jgi:SAM-dependent methyltransferase